MKKNVGKGKPPRITPNEIEIMAKGGEILGEVLKEELKRADYKIGIFGVGVDGHTAGILPQSVAVNTEEIIFGYETPEYDRITITPKTIASLDQAILYAIFLSVLHVLHQTKHQFLLVHVQLLIVP